MPILETLASAPAMQGRAGTDCGSVSLLSPPECLYVFPCQWNYRPDHCMYGSNCKGAEREGVSVLHGNRGVYHDEKQPTFKALYEAIRDVSVFLPLFRKHVLIRHGTGHSVTGALEGKESPASTGLYPFPQSPSLFHYIHLPPHIASTQYLQVSQSFFFFFGPYISSLKEEISYQKETRCHLP